MERQHYYSLQSMNAELDNLKASIKTIKNHNKIQHSGQL